MFGKGKINIVIPKAYFAPVEKVIPQDRVEKPD